MGIIPRHRFVDFVCLLQYSFFGMGDDDGWDRTSREPDNRYFFGEQGQKRGSDEQGGRPWNGNNR